MWKFLNIPIPIFYHQSVIFRAIFDSMWAQILIWHQSNHSFIQIIFPQYTQYIDKIAKDRGIIRLQNESDDFFLQRVCYAFSFLKKSSSLAGIKEIITMITKKNVEITELYSTAWIMGDQKKILGINTITNNNNLKHYFVVSCPSLSNNEILHEKEKQYISDIINIYKPAHTAFHIT